MLADVRRGIWKSPISASPPQLTEEVTFHEFASLWLAEISPTLRSSTIEDYRWALSYHLLRFFGRHLLTEVTIAEVDRYKATQVRDGRLNATSINKTLTRLGQILMSPRSAS